MGRILVVEDEFLLASHITVVLESAGHEVIGPVGMLLEAVKLATDEELDGALLDVNIFGGPIDNVADVLNRRSVPFIFVTGYSRDNLPEKFRDATIVDKPFSDWDLISQARRFLPA